MKIRIDDTALVIEVDNENDLHMSNNEYTRKQPYSFHGFIESILTPNQFKRYVGYDTHRTFTISKSKEHIILDLLTTP